MLNLTCFFFVCSDFLTRSYDVGGVVSVMALNSLYILMTQHGLEYPKFYEKLYALLVPSIFMAKHRARFFQVKLIKWLLHTCKTNQMGISSKNNAYQFSCTKICCLFIKLLYFKCNINMPVWIKRFKHAGVRNV